MTENMVEQYGGLAVGGNSQPAVADMVDTKRVHEWVLAQANDRKNNAETVSKSHIWERVDAENTAYGLHDKTIDPQEAGIKAASYEEDYQVKTKDLADQVDEMIALLSDLLSSGELRRLVAKPGITKQQAELTQKVQDSLLKEKQWTHTQRLFVSRFVRNCWAGLKVCRTHEKSYITERVEVPLVREDVIGMDVMGQPMTNYTELYTDNALMMRGFAPEQIEDGSGLRSALAEDGFNFVGIADLREDGTYEHLLCTTCRETSQDFCYIKAVNPRRFAVGDPTRPLKCQPSVHEYHYLTATELGKAGFGRVKVLEEKGKPIFSTDRQNPGSKTNSSNVTGRLKKPVYEINESWMELDWRGAIEDNEFSEDELRAFCIEMGFPVNEVQYPTAKWCVWHNGDAVLLEMEPNYLMRKDEYPYDGDSFIDADDGFCGNGQMQRMSNIAANKAAFLNMTARAIKKNLYLSMLMSRRLGLTPDDLKRLNNCGGIAMIDDPLANIEDDIHTFQVPDVSKAGMGMVAYFDDGLRGLGVPSILAGEGHAETATQDSINNRRGQTTVNDAFKRLMNVFMEAFRKHLEVMVNSFSVARYIEIMGEDGATMERRWTMPREITDKLDIVPMMSFNEAQKQQAIQFLLGWSNVVAPVLGPKVLINTFKLAMEKFGFEESDIARIMDSEGSTTNVHQEIAAMLQDPELHVEIKMEDPHPICIMMAQSAMAQEAQRYQQMGMPPPEMLNLQEYVQVHEQMMQQQQMMQQMQAMAQGGPEMQGKPVQGRPDGGPGSDEGGARQSGQAAGKGNKGPMSAAGMTGQGSPMAGVQTMGPVKGAPAGV